MGTNKRIKGAGAKLSRESATKGDFLEKTLLLISEGKVIPIISNSFRIEQIFGEDGGSTQPITDSPQDDNQDLTIEEQLAEEWAGSDDVAYPMPDKNNLARIAQYHLVERRNDPQARRDYIDFLKTLFLASYEDDPDNGALVSALNDQVGYLRFSEIVRQLDCPKFPPGVEDPLRLIARLPLPVYITTSYYNFLEQALEAEEKKPLTQVCFWSGGRSAVKDEHSAGPDFRITPKTPVVYHLFGLEDYPETLVLSEDDYINFLISVVEDTNTQKPIVPLDLREFLADFRLLFLGYQLRDWDFRVLFRTIAKFRDQRSAPRGMVIQLKPDRRRIGDEDKSRKYLSDYFDDKAFHFEWIDTESFVRKLWDEWLAWNRHRQG